MYVFQFVYYAHTVFYVCIVCQYTSCMHCVSSTVMSPYHVSLNSVSEFIKTLYELIICEHFVTVSFCILYEKNI